MVRAEDIYIEEGGPDTSMLPTSTWRNAELELFSKKGGRADRLEVWEISDRETGSKDLWIRGSSSGDLKWPDDAGATDRRQISQI
ncbi:hypothetical protein PHYSODRAFT_332185 [Phytophthora sojae]|uniref:Uncharacterized protein n=1 Tax=Phytophthora sojae (strain P6497) TaxID=1094619 RepID=G4ZDN8_PHYSP|nr:hypothetical protein PHYSODRAFT_332185 [Phytophthora sojae]EGZ18377.1 hypothetical protein PHYSODRAFT_332185 [Phytophthora sojae]|eukprot:XP_009527435.1 hypothetical protein PHYSODRAFT_332185 [Phytophthora sojae]